MTTAKAREWILGGYPDGIANIWEGPGLRDRDGIQERITVREVLPGEITLTRKELYDFCYRNFVSQLPTDSSDVEDALNVLFSGTLPESKDD